MTGSCCEEILSLVRNQNRLTEPPLSGQISTNADKAPSVGILTMLVNEVLKTTGDKVVDMYLIGVGRKQAVYQVQTEKNRHHLRLPLPFVPELALPIVKKQLSSTHSRPEESSPDMS